MASNVYDMLTGMERRGAVDRRQIQQLHPVTTPLDTRQKLAVSKGQQQEDSPGFSCSLQHSGKPNKAAPAVPIAAADSAINSTGCSLEVPDGISPDTWAAVQQTARDLDVRGVFDPKINQLRSRMLQQVKLYKDMQAAQQRAQAAKAVCAAAAINKQGAPAAVTQSNSSTLAGRLEASCAQVIGSLPTLLRERPPKTAASVMSAASGATHRTGWTCRTNKTCRATTAVSTGAATCKMQSLHPQHQQQQLAGMCLQDDHQVELQLPGQHAKPPQAVNLQGHALSNSALQQLERETSATPVSERHAAGNKRGEGVGSGRSLSCTPAPCMPAPDAAAALAAGVLEWQHQASMSAVAPTAAPQRGKDTYRSRGSTSVDTSGSSSCGVPPAGALTQLSGFRPQSQQLGVVMEAQPEQEEGQHCNSRHIRLRQTKPGKSLAACAAELAVSARPTTPTEHTVDSAAAAIQKRLSPAACEAFQTSVAAAVDNSLKLYRERLQEARQQLLQKERTEDPTQQLHCLRICTLLTSCTSGGSQGKGVLPDRCRNCEAGAPPAAAGGSNGVSSPGVSAPAADAALLTMQQLVALLAKRDAAPEQAADCLLEAKQTDESRSAAAAPLTATEAASRKLAAAQTMSEILTAAEEHIAAAVDQFGGSGIVGNSRHMRLDLGKIARVHQMGKAWHKLTARSSSSAANTGRKAKRSSMESSSGQTHDKIANNAGGGSSSRGMQPPPKPLPPGSAASVKELAAVPLPSLPELLDLSHEPAKVLQARLQRVWAVLQTPPQQQMDMILSCTTRAAASSFEEALSVWESAAATVLQREGILRQLMQLRTAMQEMQQQQTSDQQRHTHVGFESQQQQQQQQTVVAGLNADSASSSAAQQQFLLGLDAHQIHQLLWAFLAATAQVQVAAEMLQSVTGQQLALGAAPYPGPGAVVSASQLQPFLDDVWAVLGTGMIYN